MNNRNNLIDEIINYALDKKISLKDASEIIIQDKKEVLRIFAAAKEVFLQEIDDRIYESKKAGLIDEVNTFENWKKLCK
ncbi:tRNA A37 N6-isopentenylltransferase MiaA [Bacillus niacini]|uniref:tRNA A37 N6-isopentenylltransferase MiaA n=1 Tax=Neobacillus niacini TaxID=86668 RepID=A0A852TJ40_9BACI|nr:hypothetical protein [Neobacillus niacini]NYE08813.1 tRNA A37 N6-isopentenylltransferase MiaA [Neobacillus niacini]